MQAITWEGNNLAKDDVIEIEGIVTDALPNAMFKVDIGSGHTILAHISGKLRMNFIKILPGDKVTVQIFAQNYKIGVNLTNNLLTINQTAWDFRFCRQKKRPN